MELRTYKFRLYPSHKQTRRLVDSFKVCKEIHNTLLALNKNLLVTHKFELASLVTDIKTTCPDYYFRVHSQVLHNVSDRLHKAFQNFFSRVKLHKKGIKIKAGYPRFKSRIQSITYPQSGFKFVSDNRLYCSKIGNIPIVLHRVPKGKIKTLTIKVNKANQWFAMFACELENKGKRHVFPRNSKIGIDVGLESFATLSDGEIVPNPRFLVAGEKKLKMLQRRLSRKKKGSANRKKARLKVARQHLKISNQRTDFLHKLSHKITKAHSFIAVEELKINRMVKNHIFAKSINDASWNSFINMLSYKAVTCGGQLIKVNPRNTSKTCSKCGAIAEMPLNKRDFLCSSCGFGCHRDLNASLNILKVGQDLPELNACEHSVRPHLEAVVDETGTTFGKS